MRKNPLLLAFLAVALLAMVGQAQSSANREDHRTFEKETETRQATFEVPAMTKKAQVRVQVVLRSGKASWVLRDPKGVARLSGECGKGHVDVNTGEVDAIAGTWVLDIKLENATGTSQVNWESR